MQLFRLQKSNLMIATLFFGVLLACMAMVSTSAYAQSPLNDAEVQVEGNRGFGRIHLTFDKPVQYEVESLSGVSVISFLEPVRIDTKIIEKQLGRYISAIRLDPSGRALRMALAIPGQLKITPAMENIIIDILPNSWVGAPPALPDDIVQALVQRAIEAERLQYQLALQEKEAGKNVDVDLRFSQQNRFSRVQFDWTVPVTAELYRNGNQLDIKFSREHRLDVSTLNANPPRFIEQAVSFNEEGRLVVRLALMEGTQQRVFRDGKTIALDFTNPAYFNSLSENQNNENSNTDLFETALNNQNISEENLQNLPQIGADVPLDGFSAQDGDVLLQEEGNYLVEEGVNGLILPESTKGFASRDPAQGQFGSEQILVSENLPRDLKITKEGLVKLYVEEERNDLHFYLPFAEKTAMAAFRRDDILWIVTDSQRSLDTGALAQYAGAELVGVAVEQDDQRQILRIKVKEPYLISAEQIGTVWKIALSRVNINPPRPIWFDKVNLAGKTILNLGYPLSHNIHWVEDRTHGDRLGIVTAFGPAQGVITQQNQLDFRALVSANGLVILPKVDDLELIKNQEFGDLSISRPGGLRLAASPQDDSEINYMLADPTRPGYVNLSLWNDVELGDPYLMVEDQYLGELINATAADRPNARLRLAQFYLSKGLAHEALGVIELAARETPELEDYIAFHGLRGAAYVLAGNYKAARLDLFLPQFDLDKDIALWRGQLYKGLKKYGEARLNFLKGEDVIKDYPEDLQAQFLLSYFTSALKSGDVDSAARIEQKLSGLELSPEQDALFAALKGDLALAYEDEHNALKQYAKAIGLSESGNYAYNYADFKATQIGLENGNIPIDRGIRRLQSNQLTWRGDELEVDVAKLLTEKLIEQGEYRSAFEAAKSTVLGNPEISEIRDLQLDMINNFSDYFLTKDANGDEAIDALAFYYDFKEFTPNGREGDDIVRKLADHLIELDLLEQAAALLNHQVSYRLRGVAKAHVAAKLAMVYLMDQKPREALNVLQNSLVSNLPSTVKSQRILLEARALAELGRTEIALEMLGRQDQEAANRLRAEIHWKDGNWQRAGEAYEALVVSSFDSLDVKLNPQNRADLMRAAIAFALAGDQFGAERLNQNFGDEMKNAENGATFELLTNNGGLNTNDISSIVSEYNDDRLLRDFIKEYRARYEPIEVDVSDGDFITPETVDLQG